MSVDAHADEVADYDGSWKAPDVSIFLGSDVLINAGVDKTGASLNETIFNHWTEGACTYDSLTGEPSITCDRLRFGLTMFRGPDDGTGVCTDLMATPFGPREDGGGHLTEDEDIWRIDGEQYKIASLGGKTHLYCSDHIDQRPLGEVMYSYRDQRLADLGTNWPDRPQLHYHVIKNLPQDATGDNGGEVRGALKAACSLYSGNGNQHLSMPTWVMTSPNSTVEADLFAGMLSAAGGTGQCCYRGELLSNDCDPTDPNDVIDMCSHLDGTDSLGALRHSELRLRQDIDNAAYRCTGTDKEAGTGAMLAGSQAEMKCHLQGSNCDIGDYPTNLFPLMSCVQFRPSNVPAANLAVEYCGIDVASLITEAEKDQYDFRIDSSGNECIILSVANGGIEYVDEEQNLFYPTVGGPDICIQIGQGNGWTNLVCPNQGKLCDLNDGSQCSLGRYQCINDEDVCQRYPGNDSCDSSACAGESVHETGVVTPNAQFVVDRSGSMGGDRWTSATTVAKNLAQWSYQGEGCEADGTNCDKVRLGVHFWDSDPWVVHPAMEDLTSAMMGQAFSDYGPRGGTDFHRAAQLLRDEAALTDTQRPNTGIFITDGEPNHAFTTREAVRLLCDLKKRPGAPVATYAVGFEDGNQQLNSLVATAGGTGSCCFAGDGTCDTESEASPCEMYQYELDHGQAIVDLFETWLQANTSHYDKWQAITDSHASRNHTQSAYRTGTVANDLDMVDDMARFLYANETGVDPDTIDCSQNSGDATSTSPEPFYRHIICEMQNTLSYVVRHRYDNGDNVAEDYSLSSYSDLDRVDDDSAFMAHDFVCTGAKQADDENALYAELQAILMGMECTYPLSLLSDMDSAPEYTDATQVKLYMPSLDAVVSVPHTDDGAGQAAFQNEMCTLGVSNCGNLVDDGWSFANEGRTAVSLSAELCELTKTDTIEKVTTQVCRVCDPDLVGSSCDYVSCTPSNPPSAPTVGDEAFTADGQMCAWTEFPCPENPKKTCSGWAKTGRCGAGSYTCDADGFPYCEQSRSAMPEICNGVDDDCDGSIDDLSENPDDWTDAEMSLDSSASATSAELEGWYCVNRDVCNCPAGQADPIFGSKSDTDELQSMVEGQNSYAGSNPGTHCQCGEGITAEGTPALQPTRTWAPESPSSDAQASCSAGGSNGPEGLSAVLVAALFGLIGWRRRK